ncbi:MAG: hypothetical protein E7610_06145 [Ruminococcaceae bacterium]|nr:hypothetical protein [Oscillospiraceae bacterium]
MNHQTDLTKLRRLQNSICARKGLIACGTEFSVALHQCGKLAYVGTDRWGQENARAWSEVLAVTCGVDHIVGLMRDGTLRVAGRSPVDLEIMEAFSSARAVSCGSRHMCVLLGNGHAVMAGDNRDGQCNTGNWSSVVDVVCGDDFTAGLTRDGRVLIAGGHYTLRHEAKSWKNVVGLFTDMSKENLYAVTADGRLLSNARLPRKVEDWKNLMFAAACGDSIVGITAGGQLVSTCPEASRMSDAKHYVACAVSPTHILALTRDGQVLAIGSNDFGQCNTARFGCLFEDFDVFVSDQRARIHDMADMERRYQMRFADAVRYKKHMVCGKRSTVCINAEGRVLTSAQFQNSKEWLHVRGAACGNSHILALHENGRVSAEGNNVDSCCGVSDWENVKSIAAGKYHSVGLTENGEVLFCGRNDRGQGDVTEWSRIRRISVADGYTVGVTYEGSILIAGEPPFDIALINGDWHHPVSVVTTDTHMVCLYDNGTVKSTIPNQTEDWRDVREIAAGKQFTLGLCYGGRVLAAGNNEYGQCDTAAWKQVVDIGCGDGYAAALTAEGNVLVAGSLSVDVEGDREHKRDATAVRWQDVIAMQCGPGHMVGLAESGQILSCGEDGNRQCSSTAHFAVFRDVRQLYGYGQYSRRIEQEIQAIRHATEGEEDGGNDSLADLPMSVAVGRAKGRIAVGMNHTVRLDEQGIVTTDGSNDCGQRDLSIYDIAEQVAAGPYRSAVILSDGRMVMSGRNTDGQCDAQTINQFLEGESDTDGAPYRWKQVACGYAHTVAIRSDGRVFSVGANPDGRCDTRSWQSMTEVACGIRHTVGCRGDGTCIAVGDNRYGQCNVEAWKGVIAVAAGEFHSVALTSDGRVLAVGDNRGGQCDVGDLTDVAAIACLPEATLCVRTDRTVVLRGGSGEHEAALATLTGVVALDTCEHRIAAMTENWEMILIPDAQSS